MLLHYHGYIRRVPFRLMVPLVVIIYCWCPSISGGLCSAKRIRPTDVRSLVKHVRCDFPKHRFSRSETSGARYNNHYNVTRRFTTATVRHLVHIYHVRIYYLYIRFYVVCSARSDRPTSFFTDKRIIIIIITITPNSIVLIPR